MPMDIKKFQFIEGKATAGEEATIRFFDSVDAWSVSSFVDEFRWLEDWVKPSKINVLINSEGGSVLRGMGAFSVIMHSKIPTVTIVEGLAASMGSVLLAAGDVAKMRDYGIIMLHNPFADGSESEDPMIMAFQNQLKTIYKQRWGFDDTSITEIMNGPEGEDGTYFTADKAVEYGIIDQSNVIETKSQRKVEVMAALTKEFSETSSALGKIFACNGVNNQTEDDLSNIKSKGAATPEKDNNKNKKSQIMEKNFETVAAALGLSKETEAADVVAKVTALSKVEAKVKGLEGAKAKLEKENSDLVIAKAGLETSLDTVKGELADKNTELEGVKAELREFVDAKEAEVKASQEKVIDDAIAAGKIKAEAKEQWVAMAEMNFETVKSTLESMPGKTVISKEINAEAGKTEGAQAQLTDDEKAEAERKLAVEKIVGKIEYKKLN